jgi:ATP-binding cassette, subfamily B, bacterial PglK
VSDLVWSTLLHQLRDILDRRTKMRLLAATIASIMIAILDMAAIALVLPLVNLATGSGEESGTTAWTLSIFGDADPSEVVPLLTVVVVALFILKDLAAIAYTWWLAGFKAFNQVHLSSQLLRHFLTSPYTHVSRRSSAEMIRTMRDAVNQVYGSVVFGMMSMLSHVMSIVAIMVALLISAPGPALAVGAYFGIAAAIYLKVIKPKVSAAGQAASQAAEGAWRTAFAALGGLKELTLRGTQEHFVHAYEMQSMRGARANRLREVLGGLPRYLLEILFILGVGLVLLASTATAGSGGAAQTVGVLALFVAAGFRVLPSITGLLGSISSVRFGAQFTGLAHAEVVAAREVEDAAESPGPPLAFTKELRVDNVSFRYPGGGEEALSSVNVTVGHGRAVALVGGSGAGKTTLLDVVLGLHNPSSGRVTVDGVDISGMKRRWQKNVGYVPQDVFLLDATLAENIAFDQDSSEIDGTQLSRAISQAQLEELVVSLPNGVDTPIGEKGSRLSGGQRQRIGIARALYLNPELLVLDEATSALDNETEHRINETIRRLHGVITVVVVAHRLSTVRHADQIVFMKDGRVDCVGTFDQVRQQNAEFERLVQLGSLERADLTELLPEAAAEER